jgi:hypothetical protein
MRNSCLRGRLLLRVSFLFAAGGVAIGVLAAPGYAQNESLGQDAGSCTLKDHIYTCDAARFHQALLSAQTVAVDVHNWDGVARSQLKDLVTNKLGKTAVEPGAQPDLIFLLVPIEGTGVISTTDVDLGTLRIYSSTPDGAPGHLLWAETYSGPQVPWPAVVRGLIRQFQLHFQIK